MSILSESKLGPKFCQAQKLQYGQKVLPGPIQFLGKWVGPEMLRSTIKLTHVCCILRVFGQDVTDIF